MTAEALRRRHIVEPRPNPAPRGEGVGSVDVHGALDGVPADRARARRDAIDGSNFDRRLVAQPFGVPFSEPLERKFVVDSKFHGLSPTCRKVLRRLLDKDLSISVTLAPSTPDIGRYRVADPSAARRPGTLGPRPKSLVPNICTAPRPKTAPREPTGALDRHGSRSNQPNPCRAG